MIDNPAGINLGAALACFADPNVAHQQILMDRFTEPKGSSEGDTVSITINEPKNINGGAGKAYTVNLKDIDKSWSDDVS